MYTKSKFLVFTPYVFYNCMLKKHICLSCRWSDWFPHKDCGQTFSCLDGGHFFLSKTLAGNKPFCFIQNSQINWNAHKTAKNNLIERYLNLKKIKCCLNIALVLELMQTDFWHNPREMSKFSNFFDIVYHLK